MIVKEFEEIRNLILGIERLEQGRVVVGRCWVDDGLTCAKVSQNRTWIFVVFKGLSMLSLNNYDFLQAQDIYFVEVSHYRRVAACDKC